MSEGIIDVSDKPTVPRQAKASGLLHLRDETAAAIRSGPLKKGDVLEASTIAAIQAVKDTPRIVPHCHPIPIEGCWVEWDWVNSNLRCTVIVKAKYRTGVEMEALTGVSVSALTIYDMCKALSHDIKIANIQLEKKSGGKSDFNR